MIFKGGGCDRSYSYSLYHLVACQKEVQLSDSDNSALFVQFAERVRPAVSHLQASRRTRAQRKLKVSGVGHHGGYLLHIESENLLHLADAGMLVLLEAQLNLAKLN